MIMITQIFRKRNPVFFSIEKVFSLIQPLLKETALLESVTLPYNSSGMLPIFRNIFFLRIRRSRSVGIYHITGDVHYAALALPSSVTLITIHDCIFLHTNKGIKRRVLKWLFLDMPVKRAAMVTTISEFSRQEILRFTNCQAAKVVVIPNPVNSAIFFEEKPFNTEKPVIFFVGTTPNKNLDRVIQALVAINCELRILGKLNQAQEQLLLEHQVYFSVVSNITEEELARQYVSCDIVLFPSTFEGFGLPVLEAQKAGRVVITSNIDPMKTVAGGGALLVDPFDVAEIHRGIKTIIDNRDLRNNLVKKGFENMVKYDAAVVAEAYYSIYKKLDENNKKKKK